MASNRVRALARQLPLTPTDGGVNPGDPCLVGQLPGVSLNGGGAVRQAIDTVGSYNLSVNGVDQVGNSAIAAGDILYYTAADPTKLSKKNTGVRYGYALTAGPAGAVTVIEVKLGY